MTLTGDPAATGDFRDCPTLNGNDTTKKRAPASAGISHGDSP